MRVALDCRMAAWSGVGRYTIGLTRALGVRNDVEPVLVVSAGERVPDELAGFEQHPVAGSPFTPAGALGFSAALRRIRPELTHCLHFPTPFPASHPIVVTMHDLTPLLVEGVMPSGLRRKVYQWQVKRAVRVADRIVTLSGYSLSDVERVLLVAQGKGRVTGAGADDFALGPVAHLEGRLADITGPSYILSMGSTRPHKDLPTLLRAFCALAPLHPELRLVLAGEGEAGYLEHHLSGAEPSVVERAAFTGHVTDDELRALYVGAAVFAFPSLYEGFGLPPLEAMALGTPVVAARAASLPEVVGYGALLFEPGDDAGLATAIARVLDDESVRERLVATGLERSSELTWAACAQRTVDVYHELAG